MDYAQYISKLLMDFGVVTKELNETDVTLIIISVPVLALVVIGLARDVFNIYRSRSWPSVQGEIKAMSVESGNNSYKRLDVGYVYHVNGEKHYSDKIRPGITAMNNINIDLKRDLKKYSNGMQVDVYYNPNNPKQSYLQRMVGFDTIILYIAFTWVMGLMLFGAIYSHQ